MRNPAKVLRGILDERNLSHSEFGLLVGASQPTVWRWLNGSGSPCDEHAVAIEKETGIPADSWYRARLAKLGAA